MQLDKTMIFTILQSKSMQLNGLGVKRLVH